MERKQDASLSPEVQDVMKSLITAIRVVKIYPPNNPVYSQSLKKSFEVLSHFLKSSPEYPIGLQKSSFTYGQVPVGKDAQLNKSIAQDLFAKGIREIIFSAGIPDSELQELCEALALPVEELAMRSGISSILWEKGVAHIKVIEAGLDEVISTKSGIDAGASSAVSGARKEKHASLSGKTLILSEVKTNPEGFAAGVTAFALKTRAEHESIEDRLFTLYRQAGNKILKDHANESDLLFEGLARSALALEHRESFIAGKLYASLDAERAAEARTPDQLIPDLLHEMQSGRFSHAWTIQQVAALLKRAVLKNPPEAVDRADPSKLPVMPVSRDLVDIARRLHEESSEQVEALKAISGSGMESDIIEAATRTLIFLVPLVKNPRAPGSTQKETALFSGVVQQLEDMLSYLLKKNNYKLATIIIEALHMPVDPEFKPRMLEALKKTATKAGIKETIADMRKHRPGSPEYLSAYTYLASLDRKAIEVLLEVLAEEDDREARLYLLDLLKDFGKNQTALLGERLADDRWYVVRNIVSILGENKTDQAIMMLRKAADHKNVKIRQEVVKGLVSYGGKKAAALLAKFLRDEDEGVRMMAADTFADLPHVTSEDAKPLLEFLAEQPLKKKNQELTLSVIKALGKIGGWEAGEFLKRYLRISWWKPRKLQTGLRDAAVRSIEEITRREGHGGRIQR